MANYLVEVPHGENRVSCMQAIQIFLETGSHFLAKADWGCSDDEHKAWMIVDVETKEQAMQIVPSRYRHNTKITELFKITREEVEYYAKEHKLKDNERYHS
jgi:hypothetical protein